MLHNTLKNAKSRLIKPSMSLIILILIFGLTINSALIATANNVKKKFFK